VFRLIEYFEVDTRGLIGRDNANSGKREDRFYVMTGMEAKEIHP